MSRFICTGLAILTAFGGFFERPCRAQADDRTAVQAPARRPNIVMIMSDDHGWQAISAYGRPDGAALPATPNIDRLAREGMRFDRFFVENAICAPSRAAFLTGCFSSVHGVPTNAQRFDTAQPTWPAMLRDAGWTTGLIGKWHLKSDPTCFEQWEVLVDQGPYYNPAFLTPGGRVQRTGYTTDIITDRAVDWLREYARGEKPFALCVWHKAPHRNWMPAPRHYDWLADESIPEPPTLLDDWAGRSPASAMQTMSVRKDLTEHDLKVTRQGELNDAQRAAWDQAFAPRIAEYQARWKADHDGPRSDAWTQWAFQQYAKDYLRCVRAVDESVGRLLDELDALGLDENTIVIYTSDQGWFLGEHGWYDKRWMYEESFRTPFIVRWPGVTAAGSSSVALCQNVDLAPTLLDIGGQPAPARMHGRSMLPILKSKGEAPPDWRDAVYYRYYEGGDAATHSVPVHDGVRTDRWKLICFPDLPGGETWELFDLLNDPDEMRNVADEPANAVMRAELKKRLESLRSSTSARK